MRTPGSLRREEDQYYCGERKLPLEKLPEADKSPSLTSHVIFHHNFEVDGGVS